MLITGASRGVGLATAKHLAKEGFTVYGTVRSAVPKIAHVHFIDVEGCVETVLKKEGRIDILINNAGYAIVGPLEGLSMNEIKEQMDVNFFLPIQLMQEVLPSMRENKCGHIINITSTNAVNPPPFGSLYGASKSALESVSEALCVEVKPYNVSVSIVEPGLLQTGFSLIMGSREIPNNPYKQIINAINIEIEERVAHPELLTPSQSAEEIAIFLLSVIQDPKPKLRYQTSEWAKKNIGKRLLDLDGEIYLNDAST